MRDRFRFAYYQRVATPTGEPLTIRARRKSAALQPDPQVSALMPLPLMVAWDMIRALRMRRKYQGLWVVEVYRKYESAEARIVDEAPKYEAFDLVDARASEMGLPRTK